MTSSMRSWGQEGVAAPSVGRGGADAQSEQGVDQVRVGGLAGGPPQHEELPHVLERVAAFPRPERRAVQQRRAQPGDERGGQPTGVRAAVGLRGLPVGGEVRREHADVVEVGEVVDVVGGHLVVVEAPQVVVGQRP
ncbi:hypothetical protein ACFFMM_12670 [Micromonospora chaiyaphumensis]|uniref:hypothetical protein n=1 Tax=Micromonospora chaiyaphumensis TaxID=307119 RepID=UPI0011132158|nr:hypothetical protein [Micromonospora chaiyaphumensis]